MPAYPRSAYVNKKPRADRQSVHSRLFEARKGASGFAELILTNTTDGADPVIGDIFESGSGGNAVVRIALCGIISISADITYVTHVVPPLGKTYIDSIAFFLKKAITHIEIFL